MANLVEIPTCDICALEFDDNVVPRILIGCGHTICEKCIRRLMKNGQIQCPYDKKYTICRDAPSLPKNFAIAAVADELRRGALAKPEPYRRRYEELCHENPAHRATVFCEDCRADLCNECFKDIHSFNLMKHHMKNQLDDRQDQDTNCPLHRHLEVKYACMSNICIARYRLGCRWCFASGEHKEHCHMKITGGAHKEHIYFLTPNTPPPPQAPKRRSRHLQPNIYEDDEVPPVPPPREVLAEQPPLPARAPHSRGLLRTARRNFSDFFRTGL